MLIGTILEYSEMNEVCAGLIQTSVPVSVPYGQPYPIAEREPFCPLSLSHLAFLRSHFDFIIGQHVGGVKSSERTAVVANIPGPMRLEDFTHSTSLTKASPQCSGPEFG